MCRKPITGRFCQIKALHKTDGKMYDGDMPRQIFNAEHLKVTEQEDEAMKGLLGTILRQKI